MEADDPTLTPVSEERKLPRAEASMMVIGMPIVGGSSNIQRNNIANRLSLAH